MIPGAALPRLAECRDCQEPIRFVLMPSGRNMPINPKPSRDGTVAARLRRNTLDGYVITADRPAGDLRYPYRFTPHYVTCSERTTPPTPEPADKPLF